MNLLMNKKGFSLIELMIAMVIASFVMAGIIGVYSSQSKASRNQQLIVEMMQNARAAMFMMSREARLAGYDPWAHDGDDGTAAAGAGIVTAGYATLRFTMDMSNNGSGDGDLSDTDEDITFSLSGGNLLRNTVALANDIQAIAFAYAYYANSGELATTANGHVVWAIDSDSDGDLDSRLDADDDNAIDMGDIISGPAALAEDVGADRIAAVKIWLLARTRAPLQGYAGTKTYIVGGQIVQVTDNRYQHRLLSSTIRFRNL